MVKTLFSLNCCFSKYRRLRRFKMWVTRNIVTRSCYAYHRNTFSTSICSQISALTFVNNFSFLHYYHHYAEELCVILSQITIYLWESMFLWIMSCCSRGAGVSSYYFGQTSNGPIKLPGSQKLSQNFDGTTSLPVNHFSRVFTECN